MTNASATPQIAAPNPHFHDPQWWRHAVVYQVYPRSFADADNNGTGDVQGIISKLPYLADLGVDALWISPWYPSPLLDGGYDIADYQDISPQFGTLADADELIAAAHGLGLRVFIDLVPNHSSWEHPLFQAALAEAVDDAFPGSGLEIRTDDARFEVALRQPGMLRALTALRFGIEHRSTDNFVHEHARMALGAVVLTAAALAAANARAIWQSLRPFMMCTPSCCLSKTFEAPVRRTDRLARLVLNINLPQTAAPGVSKKWGVTFITDATMREM